jgi:DNA polymerase
MKLLLTPKKQAILEEMGISLFLKKSSSKDVHQHSLSSQLGTRLAPETLVPVPGHQMVVQSRPIEPNRIGTAPPQSSSLMNEAKAIASKEIQTPDVASLRQQLSSQVQSMSWSSLATHLQNCQSCELGANSTLRYIEPLAPNFDMQTTELTGSIDWLIVADSPKRALDGSVVAFSENSQSLLNSILKHLETMTKSSGAAGVRNLTPHITHTVKCLSSSQQIPSASATQICLVHLKQEIKLLQPKLLLVMGLAAAQALLKDTPLSNEPLGKLRTQVHHFENTPMIVTYALEQMMRSGVTKSNAWNDFCFAHSLTH